MTFDPVFSIFISLASIGYSSTSISVDFDTDLKKRSNAPSFYGFMPDDHRFLVMCFMVGLTTSHAAMKVIACALMMRLDGAKFACYAAGDMCMYFIYKILRGDLRYWVRLKGWFSMFASFGVRIVSKNITDFTLLVQFRHPFELGGIYWSANMIMNQLFVFVAVYLYSTFTQEEMVNDDRISSLFFLVSGLFSFSVICVIGFMSLINRDYWKTFWDTQSGKQFVVNNFKNATNDKMKFNVFKKHRSFYYSIEGEIKIWLKDEWGRWEYEKPAWFNPVAIAEVPADLLPKSVLKKMGGYEGRR